MIRATKQRWLDYWFAPVGPENLALGRIICYGMLFLLSWSTDLAPFGKLAAFWSPLPTAQLLGITAPSVGTLVAAQFAWRAALLCCCLGLLTRPAAVIAPALGFYTIGMPYNFGSIKHDDAIVVLVLGVLALARTGDAYSLDRWLARRRGRAATIAPSGEYRWPIRMIWLLTAWVLCAAGLSKLWLSGPAWVFSENLAILLLQNQYHLTSTDPLPYLGPWLARSIWLCQLLAACTLAVEVLMPLALISAWARRLLVPGALLLLIGFRAALGPDFSRLIICMVFWVPWDRALAAILTWGRGRAQRTESPIGSGNPLTNF